MPQAGVDVCSASRVSPRPVLSVILPFYRKLLEFRRVLPENARWLARDGIEVVVAMDEASEEPGLLELVRAYPGIHWKVVVNDMAHDWRPPCRAINVGLRHAEGTWVFIASPESAFAGDAPGIALDAVKDFPGGIAIGRVAFASFRDIPYGRSIDAHFAAITKPTPSIESYYGSICGPRAAFEAIGGYDESLSGWGGDDTNMRIRLETAGGTILACDAVRLLHLAFEARRTGKSPRYDRNVADALAKCSPDTAEANVDTGWGADFTRVAYANPARHAKPGDAPALDEAPPVHPSPPGSVLPTGSLRRCRACARRLYYEPPTPGCTGCTGPPAVHASRRPRIATVMQVRNEAYWLPGCLDHLRDHVDAIVALDDGSTDATAALLEREPKVVDRLANPPSPDHVWRERDNRRRLVERARELGFDWVVCCDADERYEAALLARLHAIAASFPPGDVVSVTVSLKELWNGPRQYRQDGVWGARTRSRFFRVPLRVAYDLDTDLHGQWCPDHVRKYGRTVAIDGRLYHLKTIRREDRMRWRDRPNAFDPARRFQPSDYDDLADEPADLELAAIEPGREYDYASLPNDLRD